MIITKKFDLVLKANAVVVAANRERVIVMMLELVAGVMDQFSSLESWKSGRMQMRVNVCHSIELPTD